MVAGVASLRAYELGRDLRAGATIALILVAVAGTTAAVVALVGAEARDWLGLSFIGIPNRFGEVLAIWANNLVLLAAVAIAALIAQLDCRLGPPGASGGDLADRVVRVVVRCLDLAVAGSAIVHALIVGLGTGAYGGEMVGALLPHGPLELGAYSLALALYVAARREPIAPGRWALLGASALCLLLAAPVEVYG